MNGIVFQELRESRGLAYNAGAYYDGIPDRKGHPETSFTSIISQNDKLMDCIRTFNQILDTIPQSQGAFEIAKQSLTKQLAAQRTTRFGVINAWLAAQERGIDYDINERIYNALPDLTLNDIVRFANAWPANRAASPSSATRKSSTWTPCNKLVLCAMFHSQKSLDIRPTY